MLMGPQTDMKVRLPDDGRRRVIIENPSPAVDGGRYPAKRIVGDRVVAECDLISDGHDAIAGRVLFRRGGEHVWQSAPLEPVTNDRWRASFVVDAIGLWELGFEGWIDAFTTWRYGVEKKHAAGQDIGVELMAGASLLSAGAARASRAVAGLLEEAATIARDLGRSPEERLSQATNELVVRAMSATPDLSLATRHERVFTLVVDPELARFGAWYELFPRSCGEGDRHGTFADVERRLDYVASMGFDVLYLPPIHPIGTAYRKGPNNALSANSDDVGSPWAIGADSGGHKSVHPELGTIDDVRHLVRAARAKKISVALDIAFQVSPDHPYVKAHPDWFVRRPDGTIQYAENPPKKYQDVYPFDFECDDWRSLWAELLDVFLFWIEQGVTVFRVDNPHTKSLTFWEWCIREVKRRHPTTLFLAEAFTRPKVMFALAKRGFTQSYTYFTWRTTKQEFEQYMAELTSPPISEFYRPNFWPNTPDILPEHLQYGGKPTFLLRLVLAATLASSYGIYGPPFELMEQVARSGSEEYVDNEKFQLRAWNIDDPDSLRDVIALVNRIRREHPALQQTNDITFHRTGSDVLMAFSKRSTDGKDVVLVIVNMDPCHRHSGFVDLDLSLIGVETGEVFQVHDMLTGDRHRWSTNHRFIEFDPTLLPARIFHVSRNVRSERDFEYFL